MLLLKTFFLSKFLLYPLYTRNLHLDLKSDISYLNLPKHVPSLHYSLLLHILIRHHLHVTVTPLVNPSFFFLKISSVYNDLVRRPRQTLYSSY